MEAFEKKGYPEGKRIGQSAFYAIMDLMLVRVK